MYYEQTFQVLKLYSLSSIEFYHKISRSLKTASSGVKIVDIQQVPHDHCSRDTVKFQCDKTTLNGIIQTYSKKRFAM